MNLHSSFKPQMGNDQRNSWVLYVLKLDEMSSHSQHPKVLFRTGSSNNKKLCHSLVAEKKTGYKKYNGKFFGLSHINSQNVQFKFVHSGERNRLQKLRNSSELSQAKKSRNWVKLQCSAVVY